jgi:hypothetical protein
MRNLKTLIKICTHLIGYIKMTQPKKLKIEFAPGCFDNFDGTQEELDSLIAQLTQQVESGELMEKSTPVDWDNLDDETRAKLEAWDEGVDGDTRSLQ